MTFAWQPGSQYDVAAARGADSVPASDCRAQFGRPSTSRGCRICVTVRLPVRPRGETMCWQQWQEMRIPPFPLPPFKCAQAKCQKGRKGAGVKGARVANCRIFRSAVPSVVVWSILLVSVWGEEKVMTIYDAGPLAAGPLCRLLKMTVCQKHRFDNPDLIPGWPLHR